MTVKAVILVGGEGTRLRPLTYYSTKAMVPVLNRPFLEHLLRHLASHHIREIVLAMGYKPDSIKSYFSHADQLQTKLIYSIESEPLGTAGAVKHAEQYLNDTFFVFNGDVFTNLDLTAMLHFHKKNKAKITIALTPVEDPTRFGIVETDAQLRIRRFIEKPSRDQVTTNNINAGVYILEKEVLEHIPAGKRVMFEHDVFPSLLAAGEPVFAYPTNAYWIDIGTLEKYRQLNWDLLTGKCPLSGFEASEFQIYKHCFNHPQVRTYGTVLIGEGCKIGRGVELRGPAIIGAGCQIADCAIIERSILWQHVMVGKNATLKECIATSNSYIPDNNTLEGVVVTPNIPVPQ